MKFKHSINDNKANCLISIRLDDECRNGHEDFAITADFWEVGKPRTDRYNTMGGCCHDEILKVCPEYKIFVDLHLRDFTGSPMYAVGNGMYHAFPGEYHAENASPESLAQYFNIPLTMAQALCTAEDKEHFSYLIEELNIPQLWQADAKKAIAQLESLTGEKFVSKATKSHFTPMTPEQRAEMAARIKDGYYHIFKIKQRQEEARNAAIQKAVAEVKKDLASQQDAATTAASVNIALLRRFIEKKGNWWYYHRDKSIKFNDRTYQVKFTDAEIEEATEIVKGIVPDIKVTVKK